ncbi:MAG: outer membrane protein, partial [Pedosphaera sp.]|nr:outer membrane protein [Pedosphaera sp.]
LAVCCLFAQVGLTPARAANENRGQLSSADYKFAVAATRANESEIALAQLASQKATDPAVRQFAQRMIQDHTKANQQLGQILTQKGVTVPTETSSSEQREMDRLEKLTGVDFDKAYMDHMVRDHKKDVKEFQKAADKSTDTDLKAFAANTLPTLQDHLKMAEDLDATVKAEKRQS